MSSSDRTKRTPKMVWYEEYKHCSCSMVVDTRAELLGYCRRHGHDKRRRLRIPDEGIDRGFVETG